MWFPGICKTATVKKTGRKVTIKQIWSDDLVLVEGTIWEALIGRACLFKLDELQLDWPESIPPGQRCNSMAFRLDAVE